MIVYGSEIAKSIKEEIALKVSGYLDKGLRKPKLKVILVGDNPASLSYVKGKVKACEVSSIDCDVVHLSKDISQSELEDIILKADQDETVDGILLQLPLPEGLNERSALSKISPQKDVDGLSVENKGKLFIKEDGFRPCTPLGIMEILKRSGVKIASKNAVVIGRSQLVGLPVAKMLLDENATVTICHSKSEDLKSICQKADILIVAIGKAKFITSDYVKKGAVVIDVGVNRVDGKLCGDVDFEEVKDIASLITPVPKGVGPMTIASLMLNTLKAYEDKL